MPTKPTNDRFCCTAPHFTSLFHIRLIRLLAVLRYHWLKRPFAPTGSARNSTFTYKGEAIDIKRVGEEMGVRYVLEGSLRQAAGRLRVSAHLIEAASGNHIWAERYDRQIEDIFDLQDEITMTIAAAVEPELAAQERDRAVSKPTQDLKAWDLFQRGIAKLWQMERKDIEEGEAYLRQALEVDPNFGRPHGYLAFCHLLDVLLAANACAM